MSKPDVYKIVNCQSFFLISRHNLGLPWPSFQSSLNINLKSSAVPHRFCHSSSYCNNTFSAHLVARFIAECHFVAMCACSEVHVPHINNHVTTTPHLYHKLVILLDDDCASTRDVRSIKGYRCSVVTWTYGNSRDTHPWSDICQLCLRLD